MRDYQRKKTRYRLPTAVYNRTIWTIRDYYRLKDELTTMLGASPVNGDGQPNGSGVSDPTFVKAVQYSQYIDVVNAIENSLKLIPKEYEGGVWSNILYYAPYPRNADRTTYGHLKSMFVYAVAQNLHFI